MACILLQMVSYVYYRTFRSVLRFVFYKDTKAINNAFYILKDIELARAEDGVVSMEVSLTEDCKKEHIKTFFEDIDFKFEKGYFKYLNGLGIWYYKFLRGFSFGALSNNITFLQATTIVGFLNAVIFIGINIFSELALRINPILIILSALFFYYGFLVVLTKNFIYYKYSKEKLAQEKQARFNFLLVFFAVVLVVCNRLKVEFTNNLFTLPLVERKITDEESLEKYVKKLPKDQVRYYIGCYGGGMKSNAWTMTVLKALYDQDNDIFKKTVGISGASGGTIGLANIAAILNANSAEEQAWDSIIKSISTENILSLDLTHILGRDTFNHLLVPFKDQRGKDRSSKAMAHYAKLTNNTDQVYKPTPYRAFWKKLYDDQGQQFPILISNSTNVEGNGGMAVSVRTDDSIAKKILYQDSDDVLEILKTKYDPQGNRIKDDSLTLSFFDAASTSNRFPLISPAAKIETKGHFNDGGIYENSGLLSVLKLFRAVNYLEKSKHIDNLEQCNVFISIINDKNLYIKEYLKKVAGRLSTSMVNESTEISAILNAVAATEMLPIYVKSNLELMEYSDGQHVEFRKILLPHQFTVADIKAIYGEELDLGKKESLNEVHKKLYRIVQQNNTEIKDLVNQKCLLLGKPVIEPPMSRVMAEPAYDFMKTMLNHEMTKDVMKKIKNDGKE